MVEHFTRNEVVASSILASSSKSKSLENAFVLANSRLFKWVKNKMLLTLCLNYSLLIKLAI